MTDRFAPAKMLDQLREGASPYMRDQAKAFRALSASDQRELLFYLAANMAVSQATQCDDQQPQANLQ